MNLNEILAYKQIKKFSQKKISFNSLEKLCTKCRDPIFSDLKVYMILSLKWNFDYLAKTRSNPDKLNLSLNFWYNTFSIFQSLKKSGWIQKKFKVNKNGAKLDIWENTRRAFDFMWPKNTKSFFFNSSRVLADLRLKQIISKISKNKNFFKDKTVLDSGCGPARYIDVMLQYNPKKIIGIDSGQSIINENKNKYKKYKNVFFKKTRFDKLKFKSKTIDFLISAGVLHHTKTPIKKLVSEHARIVKNGGYFFVFISGSGGQELALWKFCRRVMADVDINYAYNLLKDKISPMRIQGFLDHSYGEYKETSRLLFEKILKNNFSQIQKISGISGADVTRETFKNDNFFKKRFGSGNLRYLCKK
jgi:ubiquinone/menaquinone biosynthesis C-methylase UbiE